MDPSCLLSAVQPSGGVMGYTLGTLAPSEHYLNPTAYLCIHSPFKPFNTTVYPSADGYFHQENMPCHKAHLELDSKFVHHSGLQSIIGMWRNRTFPCQMSSWQFCSSCVMLSYECEPNCQRKVSSTLFDSITWRIKTALKVRGVQPATSKGLWVCLL